MSTTDTNISNLIINQISKSALDDLVSGSNVPANQVFVTPDDGLNISITTTQGQESISDGTNTLNFGANAFNSNTIPSVTTTSGSESIGGVSVVTRNTAQTISGAKTFKAASGTTVVSLDGDVSGGNYSRIDFLNNGTFKSRIRNNANNLIVETNSFYIGDSNNTNRAIFNGASQKAFYPENSGNLSLGTSSLKWNNLYLSGNVSDGTNSISSTQVAKGLASSISYTTTAPTAANTDGLKIVVLSSEPATRYAGWIYIITE